MNKNFTADQLKGGQKVALDGEVIEDRIAIMQQDVERYDGPMGDLFVSLAYDYVMALASPQDGMNRILASDTSIEEKVYLAHAVGTVVGNAELKAKGRHAQAMNALKEMLDTEVGE